jgi:hypothetical protein
MEKLIELVLAASLPVPDHALTRWTQANELAPLEDWPGEVSRLVTCFYANHGSDYKPANAALLKGVYKSNWLRNSLNLKAIIPLLQEFDRLLIDYRLIKGGAIVLFLGQLGARRMGDLDILVDHSDKGAVSAILLNEGFSPRYLGDRRGEFNEIWENINGNVIDLHFLKSFDLYKLAFKGYEKKEYLGYFFNLPTIESSILIAIHHGHLNHSRGDQAQGFWDIAMIYKHVNLPLLQKLAIRNGQMNNLQSGLKQLDSLGMSLNFLDNSNKVQRFLGVFRNRSKVLVNQVMPKSFPQIWNGRNTSFSTFSEAIFRRREVLYSTWALFGMLRPIERFLTLKTGGLIPKAPLIFRDTCEIELFPRAWYSRHVNFTVRSYFQNEFRVQVLTPPGRNSKLDIELEVDSFLPRMLFIDGVGFGHLTQNQGKRYGFEVNTPSDRIELSFRDFAKNSVPWQGVLRIRWSPGIPN